LRGRLTRSADQRHHRNERSKMQSVAHDRPPLRTLVSTLIESRRSRDGGKAGITLCFVAHPAIIIGKDSRKARSQLNIENNPMQSRK
jgi:hypothetical protein